MPARPTSSCAAATTWTQQAYLKASNTGAGDSFGVVGRRVGRHAWSWGRYGEDSNATGVNGNQAQQQRARLPARPTSSCATGTTWSAAGLPQGLATPDGVDQLRIRRWRSRATRSWSGPRRGQQRHRRERQSGRQQRWTPARPTSSCARGRPGRQQAYLKASNTGAVTTASAASVAVSGRHGGGRGRLRGQQRHRRERQPGRQQRAERRRGLRVRAQRHDAGASRPT